MNILVTGGAGFIGSSVCRYLIGQGRGKVINYDALTYAGNLTSLAPVDQDPNYVFVKGDILDRSLFLETLLEHKIDAVMHLAAESHVDRSITGPEKFAETNVMGTVRVLGAVLEYWSALEGEKKSGFRFHHISTDEVFGDLPFDDSLFSETTPYDPSSPYSASKAASDHFVRAWHHTYGLPVVLTNCSNNYGPYHFPEKLIPLTIINALNLKSIPVYGDGKNVRDWLYVDDHAVALESVLLKGKIGESYNIGGRAEKTNLQVVNSICEILDRVKPRADGQSYSELITFVTDRLGHDRRYAIDPSKTEADIKWLPAETFETGLEKTISWYISNPTWWEPLLKAAEMKQV